MGDDPHLALTLINSLGLLSLIVVGYGLVRRLRVAPTTRAIALGLLFATGAVIAMSSPAFIHGSVRVDGRVMIVGMAAAFGGWIPAAVSGAIVGLYRIAIGGVGMPVGLVTLTWGIAVGLTWHHFIFQRQAATLGWLCVLGLGLSLQPLFFPLLPIPFTNEMLLTLAVCYIGSCVTGAMAMGSLILREERLIAREAELSDFAYSDPLTGLANRRSFEREARWILRREPAASHALLVLDVDHFKTVNDRFGHASGDIVLRRLADALAAACRPGERVARHGGEEFTLLMPRSSAADGYERAETIRRAIAVTDIALPQDTVRLTVSIGISDGVGLQSYDKLLSDADDALYLAKRSGRNCTRRLADAALASAPEERHGFGEVVGRAHLVQA